MLHIFSESGQHWFIGRRICDKPFPKSFLSYYNLVLWTKLQWHFNRNSKLFNHENVHENIICEMAAILSRRRRQPPRYGGHVSKIWHRIEHDFLVKYEVGKICCENFFQGCITFSVVKRSPEDSDVNPATGIHDRLHSFSGNKVGVHESISINTLWSILDATPVSCIMLQTLFARFLNACSYHSNRSNKTCHHGGHKRNYFGVS